MTLVRVIHDKENPYVTINRSILDNPNISFKAKGIYFHAFGQKDDWQFYMEEIVKHVPEEIDSLRSGIHELEKHGYLYRRRERDKRGRLGKSEWYFFETPKTEDEIQKMFPKLDYPTLDNPTQANPTLTSNNTKQVISNNNKQAQNQPAHQEQSANESVVVSFLYSLPEKLAKRSIEILSSFSLDQIKRGLEAARQVENPDSFDATLITAVREGWKPKKSEDEILEENMRFLEYCKKQDGKMIGSYKVIAKADRVIFQTGGAVVKATEFLVTDKNFEAKIKKFLKNVKEGK